MTIYGLYPNTEKFYSYVKPDQTPRLSGIFYGQNTLILRPKTDRMKKNILIAALCVCSLGGFSQTQKSAGTTTETRESKKVDLTPEQRKKLTKIDRKHKADRQAIENDPSLSPDDKKIRIRKLQDEKVAKMMKVLTEDQRQQVEPEKTSNP
jgi:hypothetical protein